MHTASVYTEWPVYSAWAAEIQRVYLGVLDKWYFSANQDKVLRGHDVVELISPLKNVKMTMTPAPNSG